MLRVHCFLFKLITFGLTKRIEQSRVSYWHKCPFAFSYTRDCYSNSLCLPPPSPLLVSEYDISISYVKGVLNKAADGLSRAHDDGLVKYDDQITARHPALGLLSAPKLKEGTVLKLNDYLTLCEDYLSTHWPLVLKDYESQLKAEGKTPEMDCFKAKVDTDELVRQTESGGPNKQKTEGPNF